MKEKRKHAYCIIAHNEPQLLNNLVDLIDDERNDIFLLIDMKSDMSMFSGITTNYAHLYMSPRVDIRWGDSSQIIAELTLFEFALAHGPYQIYHLISGVDLPIKPQDYIHHFVNSHPNIEFVGFAQGEFNKQDLIKKTKYYYFFTPFMKHNNKYIRKTVHVMNRLSLSFQRVFRVNRKYSLELKKGVNWCSITNELCQYLVDKRSYILSVFKNMPCADEIYKQSMIWNSPFKSHVYDITKDFESCLREIDWKRGQPYVWGSVHEGGDIEKLKRSNAFFARKFASKEMWIISHIKEMLN